jgi:hypothetical protein
VAAKVGSNPTMIDYLTAKAPRTQSALAHLPSTKHHRFANLILILFVFVFLKFERALTETESQTGSE